MFANRPALREEMTAEKNWRCFYEKKKIKFQIKSREGYNYAFHSFARSFSSSQV